MSSTERGVIDDPRRDAVDRELAQLRGMGYAELLALYVQTVGKTPPIRDARWTHRKLGYAVQERAYGSMSERARTRLAAIQTMLGLLFQQNGQVVRTRITRPQRHEGLAAGTELRRVWHGKEERVLVRDDGKFEWNGRLFNTLTSVARAITGQAWGGPTFFGLRARSRRS